MLNRAAEKRGITEETRMTERVQGIENVDELVDRKTQQDERHED